MEQKRSQFFLKGPMVGREISRWRSLLTNKKTDVYGPSSRGWPIIVQTNDGTHLVVAPVVIGQPVPDAVAFIVGAMRTGR